MINPCTFCGGTPSISERVDHCDRLHIRCCHTYLAAPVTDRFDAAQARKFLIQKWNEAHPSDVTRTNAGRGFRHSDFALIGLA